MAVLTANDDPIEVRLFQNNITPTVDSVIADFTECDFDGYASQPLVYSGPAVHDAANHVWYQPCELLTWTRTAGPTSNDVYGCYLVDSSGRLRGCGRLDGAPASLASAGQSLSIQLNRRLSSEFASS